MNKNGKRYTNNTLLIKNISKRMIKYMKVQERIDKPYKL